MQRLSSLICLGLLAGCVSPYPELPANPDARAQFQHFLELSGDWRVVGGDHTVGATHEYRTVANGTVVVETAFAGDPHEMITTIYMDGPQLRMTHYCAAGNLPHLVALPGTGNSVEFGFLLAENMASMDEGHMHDAHFVFEDRDHMKVIWSYWEGGKQQTEMVLELERLPEN